VNDEQTLRQELRTVGDRYRRLLLRVGLAACWLALAAAGAAALAFARGAGLAVPGLVLIALVALPAVLVPVYARALRRVRDPLWVARRIERRFRDLDARLLAALEQPPAGADRPLSYLQHVVVREAIDHARTHRWEQIVPSFRLGAARLAQWGTLTALLVVLVSLSADMKRRPSATGWLAGGPVASGDVAEINVEPADTEVERGTGLLVLARFTGGPDRLPGDVQLLYRTADGETQQAPMSKSLDDPVFASRIPSVDRDLTYAVRYGDAQTRWYKATVFDYPDLKQADAKLKFPQYTGLEEKLVEDMRSVTAVEGTQARFTFRLNKPVAEARLVANSTPKAANDAAAPPTTAPAALALTADAADPGLYTLVMELTESRRFRLQLVDAQGRRNKEPPELVVTVTQNRPPDLKLEWPGRDVDVSALEELSIRARAWDDFGLRRIGVSYGMAGGEPREVVLAENTKAKETREVSQLVPLETLAAKPDELLSYYVWAEDVGPDGQVRRTDGDMFFAEVRAFEQIFRQGQQPAGGDQQQQQQQGGPNAQEAEQLAELQKQIIAATWKLIRREKSAKLSAEFAPDATLVKESQAAAREQAESLGERLQDERSRAHLKNVLTHMDDAADQLADAAAGLSVDPLPPALTAEKAAYQELLKLRAREIEVVRAQRQQQQGGAQSGAAERRQQQLEQLQLDEEQNRYEQQSSAAPPQETAQQRETRQVLNRLRELAQRQEDLNRQMRELQSALEQATEEAKREEIKRQLARLRDQQQQMLRDTDELRDRMDRPENQQRMAESREQLEQTRENVRRASEALEKGMVPEASAEGARAGERLNDLRDEFRRAAAGQFDEAMDRMRQDARELDSKQQALSDQLADMDPAREERQRALRDEGGREQVVKGLRDQKERLEKLLEEMRQTVEESEAAEPLLSKKLYDAARDAHQQKPDQALAGSSQLLERGFVDEARQLEGDATKAITRLREGVEEAAESVLGDETEALRRARNELDALAQELEREIGRRDPNAAAAASQPSVARGGEDARPGRGGGGGATTRPGAGGPGEPEDGAPQGEELARADAGRPGSREGQARRSEQRESGGARAGQRSEEAGEPGESGDESQPEGSPSQGGRGQQQGGNQPGQQGQPGQGKPGEGEPSGQSGESEQAGNSDQAGSRPGGLRQRQAGGGGGLGGPGGEREAGEALSRMLEGGGTGPAGEERRGGPITGEGFRDWSDRLRDVEESVGDPRLRAEAARIRDRAREMRVEFDRHSEEPNWDLVREFVSEPLGHLRDEVARELLRRESPEALVPIDREPVAPEYAEQVRRYYERLGGGE
jgi:hypothetical protein